jgi:L-ascorbate 6-phosphate lactonase
MKRILDLELKQNQAALWFLGQASYIARAGDVTLAIDPYLTDSAGKGSPGFSRRVPVPIEPEDLKVDILVVTHDHLDHLDPETIARYPHRESTSFVAPRFAAGKLIALGVPESRITKVDVGETGEVNGVAITGVFALPTGPDALDTTGYLVTFPNGRSFYHASDTAFCKLLLRAAPKAEVLLVPINGKWSNLDVDEAIELTAAVNPRFVLPNHYDLMALNSENPETFRHFWNARNLPPKCIVPEIMQPFVWE